MNQTFIHYSVWVVRMLNLRHLWGFFWAQKGYKMSSSFYVSKNFGFWWHITKPPANHKHPIKSRLFSKKNISSLQFVLFSTNENAALTDSDWKHLSHTVCGRGPTAEGCHPVGSVWAAIITARMSFCCHDDKLDLQNLLESLKQAKDQSEIMKLN